jgi:hypothetical protein
MASTAQKQLNAPREFGNLYATLRPHQKRLLDDYIRRYDSATGSKTALEQAYYGARMSVRQPTFDAVTHALLRTKLRNEKGRSLGRATDLVDTLDEVMGEDAGTGGEQQFRMYVYLKPAAFNALASSREIYRDKDNRMCHTRARRSN